MSNVQYVWVEISVKDEVPQISYENDYWKGLIVVNGEVKFGEVSHAGWYPNTPTHWLKRVPLSEHPAIGEWQVCPKCNGQGTVSKPPWVPGDVNEWVAGTQVDHICNVCSGAKVILRPRAPLSELVGKQENINEENKPRFIVAEVTKNWTRDTPVNYLLCQQFEFIINTNAARGYKIIDWKFTSTAAGEVLTETIIAIFELVQDPAASKSKNELSKRAMACGRFKT